MKTYILYFSPMGRTQAVADALTVSWENERVWVDLSAQDLPPQELRFNSQTVCTIAAPCIDGHVPTFLLDKLEAIKGNGAAAVIVLTYSGKGAANALCELRDAAEAAGFFVHAAVGAPAEHVLCEEAAHGRPNDRDLYELGMFGQLVRDFPQLRHEPLRIPQDNTQTAEVTQGRVIVRADFRCQECGECIEACPVAAIPDAHPNRTDKKKCIACMQCASVCPSSARHISDVDRVMIRAYMKNTGALDAEKRNTLYLRQIGALEDEQ